MDPGSARTLMGFLNAATDETTVAARAKRIEENRMLCLSS
jgi:hypothetical protein